MHVIIKFKNYITFTFISIVNKKYNNILHNILIRITIYRLLSDLSSISVQLHL